MTIKHLCLAMLVQSGDNYNLHEELCGLPFATQESLKAFFALSPILFGSLSPDKAVEVSVLFGLHLNLAFLLQLRERGDKLSAHP